MCIRLDLRAQARYILTAAILPAFLAGQSVCSTPVLAAGYSQVNLVSDMPGVAAITDPNLLNPWGIAFSSTGPFWLADNNSGQSPIYSFDGTTVTGPAFQVTVPTVDGMSSGGSPTGIVFNPSSDFVISNGGHSGPAVFIYATEDGSISGWSPSVNFSRAYVQCSRTEVRSVFKGLVIGEFGGRHYLYATDFRNDRVLVFDSVFHKIGWFTDPNVPADFAPFGIKRFGQNLWVTFAKQDAAKHDDVAGPGNGYVDEFSLEGVLERRVISNGPLNSPWGLAMTPSKWGDFGKALLVGNFGDGWVNAFDPNTGNYLGWLTDTGGNILVIPGLWSLQFGNDGQAGKNDQLFFTAGPNSENDGIFGYLSPSTSTSTTGPTGGW